MPSAKGFFPEDHPQYIGIYLGAMSSPGCEGIIDWADLVLAAGPVFTDYTTVGWTALPPRQSLINVEPRYVRFPDAEYTNITMSEFLSALAKNVRTNNTTLVEYQRQNQKTGTEARAPERTMPLTRAEMCRRILEGNGITDNRQSHAVSVLL